jgi:sterol 24-C-methyltransferase
VRGLEALRIAPKGSTATSDFLEKGALALVDAGRVGIFTPMYYVLVRKPLR